MHSASEFRIQRIHLAFVQESGGAFILSGAAINEALEPFGKGICSQALKIMQPSKLLYLISRVKVCCKRMLETSF